MRRCLFACLTIALIAGPQCVPGPDPSDEVPGLGDSLPYVPFQTYRGNIVLELFETTSPETVEAFLDAVEAGYFDGSIFHDIEADTWIRAGLYDEELEPRAGFDAPNDSDSGMMNSRGRVALYTPADSDEPPHIMINLTSNEDFDYDPESGEPVDYTVIGRVVSDANAVSDGSKTSLDLADEISQLATTTDTAGDGTELDRLPEETVTIIHAVLGYSDDIPLPPLVPDAGRDKFTRASEEAQLFGSATGGAPDIDPPQFEWTQTAGPTVALSDTTAESPTFTNPATESELTFMLTVTNSLESQTDEVTLTVMEFTETESGLRWSDIEVGTGDIVQPDSRIRVHYVGRVENEDGDIFDQTEEDPAEFPLDNLIDGWQEGLGEIEMREGGERILIIPPELAYGEEGRPPSIPPNATLWFEIEVLEIVE